MSTKKKNEVVLELEKVVNSKLKFRLANDYGWVVLFVEDEDGNECSLLSINPDGSIERHWDVLKSFGLNIDKEGRLIIG
jgi:hypothetical protein